ncbi:MAG: hypothetical protein ACK4KW_04455 [Gemmobacter sp.]
MSPVRLACLAGAAIAACSGVAVASGAFAPPEGCTGFLTVQSRNCKLSNHYICEGDPPGDQWRVDFGQYGPYFVSRIDRETQWVESISLTDGLRTVLLPDPVDPASFSGLLVTGTDTFDFRQLRDDGLETRVRGFDTLTGRKVVIDGVTLEETSFEFRETLADGTQIARARGREYISREWRMFLSGPSEWDDGEGWLPMDFSPVEFIRPGEPGFFSTQPKYECDALMSQADPAKENRHEPL